MPQLYNDDSLAEMSDSDSMYDSETPESQEEPFEPSIGEPNEAA